MYDKQTDNSSAPALPPLGTVNRPLTEVDELANRHFDRSMRLDPLAAELNGLSGYGPAYPDYGPQGRAAKAQLRSETLRALESVQPRDTVDQVTVHALRNRLTLESELHAANLDVAPLNNIDSAVQHVREIFDNMPADTSEHWEQIIARLRHVPRALESYTEGLRETAALGKMASMTQIREAGAQAEAYSELKGPLGELLNHPSVPAELRPALEHAVTDARESYAGLVSSFHEEFAPSARESDAVGEDDYRLFLRSFLGATLEPREVYEWGIEQLRQLDEEQSRVARQILPGATIREAMDALNADPACRLDSTEELQRWMQELSDRAVSELSSSHFEFTDEMRRLECKIAPTQDGGIYYTPPSSDFSRPGRMWWSVPEGTHHHETWEETTTVYHEGVPGHHLQFATALANAGELNEWRRMGIWVSGHGEGWALYAERLMEELGYLDDPGDRMGMLDAQRLRTVRVIFDVGFHCGYKIPAELGQMLGGARPGEVWSPGDGWDFLSHNVIMDPAVLRFEWLRYMGWPGQAPSYKLGQELWLDLRRQVKAREAERFDLKDFHSRALRLGSVGLDTLAHAMTL